MLVDAESVEYQRNKGARSIVMKLVIRLIALNIPSILSPVIYC